MSVIKDVYRALVSGYHNVRLSSGEILQSSTTAAEALPSLRWGLSGWNSNIFQAPWKYQIVWDIPARLTVTGEAGNPDALLDAIGDIDDWSAHIAQLPFDADGALVPWGSEQFDKLLRAGGLFTIADRFIGPYIQRVTPVAGTVDAGHAAVDLLIHVDFIVDSTPQSNAKATVFQVGANILFPNHSNNYTPDGQPYTLPTPAASDTHAQTAFARPETTLRSWDKIVYAGFPPITNDKPRIEGTDDPVKEIAVSPSSFSLSAGSPTQQLSAIAFRVSGASERPAFAWQSSNVLVAAVDATGLVTRVGAGTATITASFSGASGSAVATVS